MAWNDKELLKDVKKNPIPQEYDPVSDSYKPLIRKSFYGYSSEAKPTANIEKGSTFYEFDTGDVHIFNGLSWQVML